MKGNPQSKKAKANFNPIKKWFSLFINKLSSAFRKKVKPGTGAPQGGKVHNSEQPKWPEIAQVYINILLMVGTFLLFWQAINQNDAALKSVKLAQEANDLTKKSFDSSAIESKKMFELAEKSLQAQIESIKGTERQFAKDNQPYLQITKANIDTFMVGHEIGTMFDIENIGKYPVKVLASKVATAVRISPPHFNDIFSVGGDYTYILNSYIAKDEPFKAYVKVNKATTEGMYWGVTQSNYYIYFWGYCIYQNLVTGKRKNYKFMIKFKPFSNETDQFLLNENVDLDRRYKW